MKAKKSSLMLSKWATKLLGKKNNYRLRYFHQHGHFPSFSHPQDMSEILISKMFDPDTCKHLSRFVDKLAVRDYIREKGLDHILLRHYGVWDTPEEVPFDQLPQKFVLKSNNGCGDHVICHDKTTLDKNNAIETLHRAIRRGQNHVEPHYNFIIPKIFAEELIETPNGDMPVDYKFTCINGEIMDIFVASERTTNAKYSTLDCNWNPLPYTKNEYLPGTLPPRPKNLKALVEIARTLSKDFDFIRVDLYEYHDQPYFSELTFFPWGGLLYSYKDEIIKMYGRKFRKV